MRNKKLNSLIKLLDDEDSESANLIMAELLSMDKEAESLMSTLQESNKPGLRKRAHQLQAILRNRRKRTSFSERLINEKMDLLKGLNEVHMLWYDEDTEDELKFIWNQLVISAREWEPYSCAGLAEFMKDSGFKSVTHEDILPDYFCIGAVIEDLIGTDFMLCAIASCLAQSSGWKCEIGWTDRGFAIRDKNGKISLPSAEWAVFSQRNVPEFEKYSARMLIKLTTSMLFLSAMISESYRYVYTIGTCLAGDRSKKNLHEILPYPFGGKI